MEAIFPKPVVIVRNICISFMNGDHLLVFTELCMKEQDTLSDIEQQPSLGDCDTLPGMRREGGGGSKTGNYIIYTKYEAEHLTVVSKHTNIINLIHVFLRV